MHSIEDLMEFILSSTARRRDGFTLIELMISMAIVGILSAVAFAGWENMQVMSMATEAKQNLSSLRTMAEAYQVEYSVYASSLTNIGFMQPLGARYTYSIADAGENSCTLQADGKAGTSVEGDIWYLKIIDHVANLPSPTL